MSRRSAQSPKLNTLQLPKPIVEEWNWQSDGACNQYPPELFFPDELVGSDRQRREQKAKSICAGCPVLIRCRQHALTTPEPYGIWGAMTARERHTLLGSKMRDGRARFRSARSSLTPAVR